MKIQNKNFNILTSLIVLIAFRISFAETTVRLPLKAVPTKINIEAMVQVEENWITDLLIDTLFTLNENFQVVPVLAETARFQENQKEIIIKLKRSEFSDGSLITADDVIYSLHKCIKGADESLSLAFSKIAGYADFKNKKKLEIQGLIALSPSEIKIQLAERAPLILENLAFNNCGVIKKNTAIYENDVLRMKVTSGPYAIKSTSLNEIVLSKRANYHKTVNNAPSKIIFQKTDHFGAFDILKNEFDMILADKDSSKPLLTKEFTKYENSQLAFYQLAINCKRKPLSNSEIRNALHLALDFKTVQTSMNLDSERMQLGIFPFGMQGFKTRKELNPKISQAEKILKKYGYTKENPLKIEIIFSKSSFSDIELKVWPTAFATKYIRVVAKVLDQKDLITKRNSGNFDLLRVTKYAGSTDGGRLLASYLSYSKYNTPQAKYPECDKKILSALNESSSERRLEFYQKAEDCLISRNIFIPIATIPKGYIFLRKPWVISAKNQYYLKPYFVHEWSKNE